MQSTSIKLNGVWTQILVYQFGTLRLVRFVRKFKQRTYVIQTAYVECNVPEP